MPWLKVLRATVHSDRTNKTSSEKNNNSNMASLPYLCEHSHHRSFCVFSTLVILSSAVFVRIAFELVIVHMKCRSLRKQILWKSFDKELSSKYMLRWFENDMEGSRERDYKYKFSICCFSAVRAGNSCCFSALRAGNIQLVIVSHFESGSIILQSHSNRAVWNACFVSKRDGASLK